LDIICISVLLIISRSWTYSRQSHSRSTFPTTFRMSTHFLQSPFRLPCTTVRSKRRRMARTYLPRSVVGRRSRRCFDKAMALKARAQQRFSRRGRESSWRGGKGRGMRRCVCFPCSVACADVNDRRKPASRIRARGSQGRCVVLVTTLMTQSSALHL